MSTTTRRKILTERKALLEKGPLNWTDTDIAAISAFTMISEDDLTAMRHKMQRASEWSIRDLTALDEVINHSDNPAKLRSIIERDTSVADGLERAKTFTGLFNRIKDEVAAIDAELRESRPGLAGLLLR